MMEEEEVKFLADKSEYIHKIGILADYSLWFGPYTGFFEKKLKLSFPDSKIILSRENQNRKIITR